MTDKYNDLNYDLRDMQSAPPPRVVDLRKTELGDCARELTAALRGASETLAHCLTDISCGFKACARAYVSSDEWRHLRRFLRAHGFLDPLPTPVSRYKAHGRLRSRRELRDIRDRRR